MAWHLLQQMPLWELCCFRFREIWKRIFSSIVLWGLFRHGEPLCVMFFLATQSYVILASRATWLWMVRHQQRSTCKIHQCRHVHFNYTHRYGGNPRIGVPKNGWFMMEKSHLEMDDDWGCPHFRKPPYIRYDPGYGSKLWLTPNGWSKTSRIHQSCDLQDLDNIWKQCNFGQPSQVYHSIKWAPFEKVIFNDSCMLRISSRRRRKKHQ